MAIKDIYLLPRTIIIDIDILTEYVEVDVNDIMNVIKKRYKGDIEFTIEELQEYINIIKKKKTHAFPLPISASELKVASDQENVLDSSPSVDYKNRASVMEYYRHKVLQRFRMLEEQQGDGKDKKAFMFEVEALMLQYMKVGAEMIEKEEKLKLNFQDSSKYEGYIKEQVDKLLIIVRGVIKGNVSEEQYKKIIEQLAYTIELYKF